MISVLFIDDELALLALAKRYLESDHDITCTTLSDPLIALNHIENGEFDAIISDYDMPVLDGIHILKKLRSEDSKIPYIIFTGKGREEVAMEALNLGASFYLQKGSEPATQFAELRNMILQSVNRMRAEVAEKKSYTLLNTILSSLDETVIIVNPITKKIEDCNSTTESMFGYLHAGIIGNEISILHTDIDNFHKFEMMTESALLKSDFFQTEFSMRRKNGEIFPTEHFVRPIEQEKGGYSLIVSIIRDISERKKALEARFFLASIVESSSDAIIGQNSDGGIYSWNYAAERLYGYKAEEVIGQPIDFLLPPEFQDEFHEIYSRVMQGERIESFETVRLTKNGMKIPILLTISPIFDSNNNIIGSSSISHDITEQYKVEDLKQRAFDQINKNYEQLAILNDQIRNPLAVIVAIADIYGGDVGEKIIYQAREIDSIIHKLDEGWCESEKVRSFLNKHYNS